MSRSNHVRFLIFILLLLVSACVRESATGDQAATLQVELRFEPDPPVVGEGTIEITVKDERGKPVEGIKIQVKGDMTHAGMTPVFGVSIEHGEGRYSVPFKWGMAGDWILQFSADLPNDRLLNRSFEVRVLPE